MRFFTKHLDEVGETYLQHCKQALKISFRHLLAGSMQLVHAIFPFVSPPRGTDVDSMLSFLSAKSPNARKKKNLEKLSR